jgi:hypothetical protein
MEKARKMLMSWDDILGYSLETTHNAEVIAAALREAEARGRASMTDRDYGQLCKAAQIALQFITNEYSSERSAALDGDPLAHQARPIRDALLAAMYGEGGEHRPLPTEGN